MIDSLKDVAIEVIQTLESLLGLAYELGLEPLLAMVLDGGIPSILARVEGSGLKESLGVTSRV